MQYETFNRFCMNSLFLTICFGIFIICLSFYAVDDKSTVSLAARFICGITFVFPIYKYVKCKSERYYDNVLGSYIAFLGKNTIAIYAMQEFFRPLFENSFQNIFYDTILKVLSAIIICVITVLIKLFIESISPVLSFLMFGTKLIRKQEI